MNDKEFLAFFITFFFFILYAFDFQKFKRKRKRRNRGKTTLQRLKIKFQHLTEGVVKNWNKWQNDLTDNVLANKVVAPFLFVIMTNFIHFHYSIPYLSETDPFAYGSSSIAAGFYFTVIYLYASQFYQPDLDVNGKRPGMTHFPLGFTIGRWNWGRFLKWCFYPITVAWYKLWTPYAKILTHRGIGHYPVLGVWLRAWYLLFWVFILKFLLYLFYIDHSSIKFISHLETWLKSFFPWDKNFGNIEFFIMNFSIYTSDFIHWSVDYWDSMKRGLSFCPPKIPRGLLSKFIDLIFRKRRD